MIPEDWVGREIDGRYAVESVLGVGGMGTVLRAKHKFTGVAVAIKVLRTEMQLDAEVQARFLAEAQAPNMIGHPAIVKVLDAGRMPEGPLYMAMELLAGRTLRVALMRRELGADQIRRIVLDLCEVLAAAHAKGFVHRDLKPDNVFLCPPQRPGAEHELKLLDFGIAKVIDDARGGRTLAGALLGTPAYMAPEQLADARNVDARADLWALGVMTYEMVSGHLPLQGATQNEILAAVAAGTTTPIRAYLPHVSRELEAFFERALAPDPRRRFGAAVELAQALPALPGAQPAPRADLGYSATVGTNATVASVAAPINTPMAPSAIVPQLTPIAPSAFSAPAQPTPTPMMPSAVTPTKSNRTTLIAIGAMGALAVIGIVIGVAVSGGGKPTATPDAAVARAPDPPDRVIAETPRPPDAPTETDDDFVTRLVDAGPRAVDAAPRRTETVVTDGRAACKTLCATVLKKCGTTWGNCEQECNGKPAQRRCLERSLDDCSAGAMCATGVICNGTRPSGTATCAQAAACEGRCNDYDFVCGCACTAQLDPQYILPFAQLNGCVFRCNLQLACIQRNCQGEVARCR